MVTKRVPTLHRLATLGASIEACVSSQAASLRSLTVRGIDLVDRAPSVKVARSAAGAILAPWPNRVDGATWRLGGVEQHLEVTEPQFGHAIHGLLLEREYEVEEGPGQLTLRTVLSDATGYPFRVEVEVNYALEERGISVTHTITNTSEWDTPFALGAHPYLRAGRTPVDSLTLTVTAERALALDKTNIPRGEFAVAGTAWDLRPGRRVGDAVQHATYGHFVAEGGRFVHRLSAADGTTTELWTHPDFAWLQVYISSGFGDDGRQSAIAIEPMTAPPNALRTGRGLRWLAPGEVWELDWGIRLAEC